MTHADWLPSLVLASDFVDFGAYLAHLEDLFQRDYVRNRATFQGRPVRVNTTVVDGRMEGFWHLCSKDPRGPAGSRDLGFDMHRASHIQWARAMIIEARVSGRVHCWADGAPGRGTKWYICPLDFSYVVVLGDRGKAFQLLTAFPTDAWSNYSEKLRAQFEAATTKS